MKYPEHKLSMEAALPSTVQSWLGNELEIRGIDSVIYSRYIIHMLLDDQDEEGTEYLELFFNPRLDLKSKLKKCRRSHSLEEKKKQAAIECLQAITEEKCGIEMLVEELSNKLKELTQSSGSDDTDQGDSTPSLSDGSCSELDDPAERYYAAFPALTVHNDQSNSEICHLKQDIWKDNPFTKQPQIKKHGYANKDKKASKLRGEKKFKKKSPKSDIRRKTLEKPIPKPKAKPSENFHARFMSWPRAELIQGNETHRQSKEEKRLCKQVEHILKEMLLNGKGKKIKSRVDFDSDGCISPELQENAFWYTPQFADMISSVETSHPLYERHSCPFFYNDDVFTDPDSVNDGSNHVAEDDQFGLHDLMKQQELKIVAESVLQSVDEDFSKKELETEVENEIHPKTSCTFDQDIGNFLTLECKVDKLSPSPYDIPEDFLFQDVNGYQAPSMEIQPTDVSEYLAQNTEEQSDSTTPFYPPSGTEEENMNQYLLFEDQPVETPRILCGDSVNNFAFPNNNRDSEEMLGEFPYSNGNYSQLWDINLWNRPNNQYQKFGRNFLEGFDSTFDEFKSGLGQYHERPSNRNSGIFQISMLNEDFDLYQGENVNTLIPKITFEAVDFENDHQRHEDFQNSRKDYDRSISLTDVHLLRSMKDTNQLSNDMLSKSFELIPSNNSAFKDVIPRKITHVLSDSNISYFNLSTTLQQEENLPQEEVEDDKKENLYLSPKTHFRPISTLVEDDLSDLNLRDLFGGCSSSRTQYQKYQDVAQSGDENSFVPMFKVCKQHDKYIQTGSSIDNPPSSTEQTSVEDKGRPPECKAAEDQEVELAQEFDVYGYVDSLTASAQHTPQNLLDVACSTCFDSGYEEANDEDKVTEEKIPMMSLESRTNYPVKACKWVDIQKEEEHLSIDNDESWTVADSNKVSSGLADHIWSCNEDNYFPDMFSFFSDDCDDLQPHTSADPENKDPIQSHLSRKSNKDPGPFNDLQASNDNDVTKVKLVIGKGKKVLQDIENCPRGNMTPNQVHSMNSKGYMPMPSVAVYSCELEKEWLDKSSMQCLFKNKSFKGSGKKPCTFYMEGSCKRSDCKFSHDLSSITCRFWAEGECFKGELCPFLHGYYASDDSSDSKENIDEQFELQDDEFPHLSLPSKRQKMKSQKSEKSNTYVESRKMYRTSGTKQKSVAKSADK